MKRLLLFLCLVLFVASVSGCAEFLEDYQYSPIGTISSAGY